MIDMSSITNEMEENSIQLVNIVESIAKETLNSPNSCRVLKNILLK